MPNPDWKPTLHENIARVRRNIADAGRRVGRDPDSVRLVGVTKYVSPEVLRELPAAGVTDIGESRVQQLVTRAQAYGPARLDWSDAAAQATSSLPRWHMIGHLQRNKVKLLLPHSRVIHSLDSERLATTIQNQAQSMDAMVDAFIEVNVSGETSKQGVTPDQVEALVQAVSGCPRIRLRGLMTMAPYNPDPEASRPCFVRLRELLERLRESGTAGPECTQLSMGMSQDYVVAVEEGATFVRVGSALFENLPSIDPRGG
ncbi:MAG: YggS family pyridoxal phosphate-dependent enzyme [Phycisphaerae bacterium]|nr:YggS family pyridoxal phosphate-dependent enzyme [Phycisphaerae bacterium]